MAQDRGRLRSWTASLRHPTDGVTRITAASGRVLHPYFVAMDGPGAHNALSGRVGCVAGATRGAGRAIAVELARAGAFVYATGRSSRETGPSDMGRPEVIEETAELMSAAGGEGVALRVDHLEETEVVALRERVQADHGRLDVLVNDIFGGGKFTQWERRVWEHDLDPGFYMLRMGLHTHLINIRHLVPLMLENPDASSSK